MTTSTLQRTVRSSIPTTPAVLAALAIAGCSYDDEPVGHTKTTK